MYSPTLGVECPLPTYPPMPPPPTLPPTPPYPSPLTPSPYPPPLPPPLIPKVSNFLRYMIGRDSWEEFRFSVSGD